jgi:hypothetical protein
MAAHHLAFFQWLASNRIYARTSDWARSQVPLYIGLGSLPRHWRLQVNNIVRISYLDYGFGMQM